MLNITGQPKSYVEKLIQCRIQLILHIKYNYFLLGLFYRRGVAGSRNGHGKEYESKSPLSVVSDFPENSIANSDTSVFLLGQTRADRCFATKAMIRS